LKVHNHEVPSSILGLATTESPDTSGQGFFVLKPLSLLKRLKTKRTVATHRVAGLSVVKFPCAESKNVILGLATQ
jgi:hypothetical protein